MKILTSVLLALVLSIAVAAQSQSSTSSQSGSQAGQGSQSQGSQNQSGQAQTSTSTNAHQNMSGTVSRNGKSFTNDKNNQKYRVDNPNALQGEEGQHVALLVQVDPDNNVIHVVQIEPQQ